MGSTSQILANQLEHKLREDLERLKKIRAHRGLRHYWGVRVRGQHTKDHWQAWTYCGCIQEKVTFTKTNFCHEKIVSEAGVMVFTGLLQIGTWEC